MNVAGLFRYPVKSMAGESLQDVHLSAAGLKGDRVLALRDRQTGFAEDELIGAELVVGEALLRLDCPTPRCIVPTLPLSDLPPNLEVLRALARYHRVDVAGLGRFACLGAYASVVREGTVHLGDPVRA